jgi:hypothetical protein
MWREPALVDGVLPGFCGVDVESVMRLLRDLLIRLHYALTMPVSQPPH